MDIFQKLSGSSTGRLPYLDGTGIGKIWSAVTIDVRAALVSSIDEALFLYKASRSATGLTRTIEALKMVLRGLSVETR